MFLANDKHNNNNNYYYYYVIIYPLGLHHGQSKANTLEE